MIIFKECFRTAQLIMFKVYSFVTPFPNTEVPGWGVTKSADMINGFDFSASKKAYFKCLGNSFIINPSKLVSPSYAFPSQLLEFSELPSFRLSTVSLNSKLEFINSKSRSSRYWKFISFSFIELLIL